MAQPINHYRLCGKPTEWVPHFDIHQSLPWLLITIVAVHPLVWRIEAQNGPEVKVDYIRSPVAAYC